MPDPFALEAEFAAGLAGLNYRAELVVDFVSGRPVVWIEYRTGAVRRRRRFYLVPDEGETFESVAGKIVPAIAAHALEQNA